MRIITMYEQKIMKSTPMKFSSEFQTSTRRGKKAFLDEVVRIVGVDIANIRGASLSHHGEGCPTRTKVLANPIEKYIILRKFFTSLDTWYKSLSKFLIIVLKKQLKISSNIRSIIIHPSYISRMK